MYKQMWSICAMEHYPSIKGVKGWHGHHMDKSHKQHAQWKKSVKEAIHGWFRLYEMSRTGKSKERERRQIGGYLGLGWRGKRKWVWMGSSFGVMRQKVNNNIPDTTKLSTLKWILLYYMDLISINYFPQKNPTVPHIFLPVTGSWQREPGEHGFKW